MLVGILCGPDPISCDARRFSTVLEVFGEHRLYTAGAILSTILPPPSSPSNSGDGADSPHCVLVETALKFPFRGVGGSEGAQPPLHRVQAFLDRWRADASSAASSVSNISFRVLSSRLGNGDVGGAEMEGSDAAGFALLHFSNVDDGRACFEHVFVAERGTHSSSTSVLTAGEAFCVPSWLPADEAILGSDQDYSNAAHDGYGGYPSTAANSPQAGAKYPYYSYSRSCPTSSSAASNVHSPPLSAAPAAAAVVGGEGRALPPPHMRFPTAFRQFRAIVTFPTTDSDDDDADGGGRRGDTYCSEGGTIRGGSAYDDGDEGYCGGGGARSGERESCYSADCHDGSGPHRHAGDSLPLRSYSSRCSSYSSGSVSDSSASASEGYAGHHHDLGAKGHSFSSSVRRLRSKRRRREEAHHHETTSSHNSVARDTSSTLGGGRSGGAHGGPTVVGAVGSGVPILGAVATAIDGKGSVAGDSPMVRPTPMPSRPPLPPQATAISPSPTVMGGPSRRDAPVNQMVPPPGFTMCQEISMSASALVPNEAQKQRHGLQPMQCCSHGLPAMPTLVPKDAITRAGLRLLPCELVVPYRDAVWVVPLIEWVMGEWRGTTHHGVAEGSRGGGDDDADQRRRALLFSYTVVNLRGATVATGDSAGPQGGSGRHSEKRGRSGADGRDYRSNRRTHSCRSSEVMAPALIAPPLPCAVSITFAHPFAALLIYDAILRHIRVESGAITHSSSSSPPSHHSHHHTRALRVAFGLPDGEGSTVAQGYAVPSTSVIEIGGGGEDEATNSDNDGEDTTPQQQCPDKMSRGRARGGRGRRSAFKGLMASLRSRSPTPPRVQLEGVKVGQHRLSQRLGKGNNAVVMLGELITGTDEASAGGNSKGGAEDVIRVAHGVDSGSSVPVLSSLFPPLPRSVAVKVLFLHSDHASAEVNTLAKAQISKYTPRMFENLTMDVALKNYNRKKRCRKGGGGLAAAIPTVSVQAVSMELLGTDLFELAHTGEDDFDPPHSDSEVDDHFGDDNTCIANDTALPAASSSHVGFEREGQSLTRSQRLALILGMLDALTAFHAATGMVHGSVKLENFCVPKRHANGNCDDGRGAMEVRCSSHRHRYPLPKSRASPAELEGLQFAQLLQQTMAARYRRHHQQKERGDGAAGADDGAEPHYLRLLDFGRARPADAAVREEPFTGWWYSDWAMMGVPLRQVDDLVSLVHAATYLMLAGVGTEGLYQRWCSAGGGGRMSTVPFPPSCAPPGGDLLALVGGGPSSFDGPASSDALDVYKDAEESPHRQFVACRKARLEEISDMRRALQEGHRRRVNFVALKRRRVVVDSAVADANLSATVPGNGAPPCSPSLPLRSTIVDAPLFQALTAIPYQVSELEANTLSHTPMGLGIAAVAVKSALISPTASASSPALPSLVFPDVTAGALSNALAVGVNVSSAPSNSDDLRPTSPPPLLSRSLGSSGGGGTFVVATLDPHLPRETPEWLHLLCKSVHALVSRAAVTKGNTTTISGDGSGAAVDSMTHLLYESVVDCIRRAVGNEFVRSIATEEANQGAR